MKSFTCLVLLLITPNLVYSQFGFDLSQQIFKQVQDSFKMTQNIGSQIAANVNRQISSAFQNMGFGPMGFPNLGNQIASQVHNSMPPFNFGFMPNLSNLGQQITSQINKQLQPVYALTLKSKMSNGQGGTTVATYKGNRPRSFIIKNGVRYVCNGYIDGPNCRGSLDSFEIQNREDFCYATQYSSVNNYLCLAGGSFSVQAINDNLMCSSDDGSPILKLSKQQYRQLCGNRMPWQVRYTYYPNPNDPEAVPIPNPNPYVTCLNNQPGVCEFEGSQNSGSGTIISSNNMQFNYQGR